MSDVTQAVEEMVRAGLAATYNGSLSLSDTYQVQNDGRTFLHFKKSQAADCIVTIVTTAEVDGKAVADQAVTVPASTGDKFIGPFPPAIYNVKGENYLEYTLGTNIDGLTVALIRMK